MKKQRLAALCLAVVTSFSLCGCRETDRIQKIVYNANAEETDDIKTFRDDLLGDMDENSFKKKDFDQAKEKERKKQTKEGENANSTETADVAGDLNSTEIADSVTGNYDSHADSGNSKNGSDQNVGGSGEGSEGKTGTVGSEEEGDAGWEEGDPGDGEEPPQEEEPDNDGEEPPQEEEPDNEEEPQPDNSGGESGKDEDSAKKRQVYDAYGNIITLPENINSVAAPGEAGLIAQMLGGENILTASTSSLLNNTVAQAVFADEGIGETVCLWSNTEDGSLPMPEEEFQQLLALSPDCCFGISGQTNFSDDQLQALAENDIAYVLLPDMTTSVNIKTAVQVVGSIFGEHVVGETTSEKLAQTYVDYETELVQQVALRKGWYGHYKEYVNAEKTTPSPSLTSPDVYTLVTDFKPEGKYAVVFWDWDPTATVVFDELGINCISQSGVAVARSGWNSAPATYYMNVAAVENTMQRDGWEGREDKNYAYVPLSYLGFCDCGTPLLYEDPAEPGKYVITPSNLGFFSNQGGGVIPYAEYRGMYPLSFEPEIICHPDVHRDAGTGKSTGHHSGLDRLGNQDYCPYAIAASQEIADNINASKADPNGLYYIRPKGIEVPGLPDFIIYDSYNPLLGIPTDYPSLAVLGDLENLVVTTRMDYGVVVNPSGAGSWLNGSVESCLESVWISSLYFGDETYPEAERNAVIADFYRTFYRCDDAPLSDILDGTPQ